MTTVRVACPVKSSFVIEIRACEVCINWLKHQANVSVCVRVCACVRVCVCVASHCDTE